MEIPRTSPIEEWESVGHLPFEAQMEKLISVRPFEDFMKAAIEIAHRRPLGNLSGEENEWISLPLVTDAETGNTIHETLRLSFSGGRLEISHIHSVTLPNSQRAIESTNLTAKFGVWHRQDKPMWEEHRKALGEDTGKQRDVSPTADDESYLRARVTAGLLWRNARENERKTTTNRRKILTISVRDKLL